MMSSGRYYQSLVNLKGKGKGTWQISFFKGALPCLREFLATENPLKMMKMVFLFHLESSFCSQDVYVFVFVYQVVTS